jgi:flagellar assembly protein FliH
MSSSTDTTVAVPVHPASRAARVVRGSAAASALPSGFRTVRELEPVCSDHDLLAALGTVDRQMVLDAAERGYRDGAARGHAEGYQVGLEHARQELMALARQALLALEAAAGQLRAHDAVTLDELDRQIAGFAVDVAGSIVGEAVAASAHPGLDAIARAIRFAPDRGPIIARLHPRDLDTLDDLGAVAPGRDIELVPDASVQLGGCVLEVGACRVDAQVGAALDRVRQTIGAPVTAADRAPERPR